jgi:FkbM family methyltransferase
MKRLKPYAKSVLPPSVWNRGKRWNARITGMVLGTVRPAVTCTAGDISFKVHASNELEWFRARTLATKEPETLSWLRSELRPSDVFYDVGANIGLYTIFANKVCPACKVYAFEPESQNYAALCSNFTINDFPEGPPVAICSAVGAQDSFGFLDIEDGRAGSAVHAFNGRARGPFSQGCLAFSIDSLVARFGLPGPTLIKIDTDGHESEVIAGADVQLRAGRIRSLLIELPAAAAESERWGRRFAALGYSVTARGLVSSFHTQNHIFSRTQS